MIRVSTPSTHTDAVLINKAFDEVRTLLSTNVTWLDRAYGVAELSRDQTTGKTIKSPVIYIGTNKGKESESLFPDSHKGSFSFFKIEDGIEINQSNPDNSYFNADFSLIVWFDYRKLYPTDWKERTVHNAIEDIFTAFKNNTLANSDVRLLKYFTESENIYKGYSDVELNHRSLTRPFGGFKIEGTIKFSEKSLCV
jgi:hypothetical protein